MQYSPLIQNLVDAFRRLPGVGQKSAQRMVLHFLEKDREGGMVLAKALQEAMEGVGQCSKCRTLTEADVCDICSHPGRDHSQLCVVETPADVYAVEQSQSYRGLYFVLMGHLSPIDGIGPEELGLNLLRERVREVGITEIIIATNPTVEGEATAYYIAEQFRAPEFTDRQMQISRIAQGVPMGGELEYVDGGTLLHSFSGRTRMVIPDHES